MMMKPFHYMLIALWVLMLAACTSAPVVAPVDRAAREAEAAEALERGAFTRARDLYGELAASATGRDRSAYALTLARIEIELGSPEAALARLDGLAGLLSPDLELTASAVRARAWFALGRTVEAVSLLVERDVLLDSSAAVIENQNLIWEGLSLPASQAAAGTRTGDATVDGWLALAPLTGLADDAPAFLAALLEWREQFASHPAAAGLLAERVANLRPAGQQPGRIALLLPLTSELRPQALAVRDGFIAAHYARGNGAGTTIEIYDTARQGSVESYLAAQLEGADFIVGPLLPDEVTQIQSQAGFVPTLALNVGTAPAAAATSFFQYALSSDDEIQAIATRAIAAGHETAAILHSSNDRGYRIMNAFREAFESRGGRVVSTAAYVPGSQNFSAPVETLLNVTQSDARFSTLRANLREIGRSAIYEPRRREDIDMIFVQAEPAEGRLLIPLLKDIGAGDVPTYAISEVYDPARRGGDADLDGLVFPDLPLLIDPEDAGGAPAALSSFSSQNAERQQRLFAFGFDAYRLAEVLYGGGTGGWLLDGATGELHLEPDGRIRRVLPFAEFSNGRPALAEPLIGTFGAR